MVVLSIRTDNPTAEVGVFDNDVQIAYETWEAGRSLSTQLHGKIESVLQGQGKALSDLQGVVCFAGPGSFTGLRIGLTVGNALAYALGIPIVAMQNPEWVQQGVQRLERGEYDPLALPHYGAPVHITTPKR